MNKVASRVLGGIGILLGSLLFAKALFFYLDFFKCSTDPKAGLGSIFLIVFLWPAILLLGLGLSRTLMNRWDWFNLTVIFSYILVLIATWVIILVGTSKMAAIGRDIQVIGFGITITLIWCRCFLLLKQPIISYVTILLSVTLSVGFYIHDRTFTGIERGYYTKKCGGQLCSERSFKDGQLNGLSKYYFQNGQQLEAEVNYKNNQMDGVYKEYHENGKVHYERIYQNDQLQSNKVFYASGELEGERTGETFVTYYKSGKIECEIKGHFRKCYHENGKLKEESESKYGRDEATVMVKTYYASGGLESEINDKEGYSKGYYEDGKLQYEGYGKKGEDKTYTEYYPSGKIRRKQITKNGQRSDIQYDEAENVLQ